MVEVDVTLSLELPDEEELKLVAAVREQLRESLGVDCLEALPDDFCDDLQVARFLRGHGSDPEKASSMMVEAINYRRELIKEEPFQALRKASADLELPDLKLLPYASEMLDINPMFVVGWSADNLPVMTTCPRLMDFDLLSECVDTKWEQYQAFLKGMLEQRAVVLHNLSHKQKRMVKCVDLRDLNQLSVGQLLTRGYATLGKLKDFLSVVQNYYPEIIHKVIMFNAPTGVTPLVSLLGTFMNERMMSKIRVCPIGDLHPAVELFQPRAIHNWVSTVASRLRWREMNLANGTQEYCSFWIHQNVEHTFKVTLHEGDDLKVRRIFVPATEGQVSEIDEEEINIKGNGETHGGTFARDVAGVLWLSFDNSASWWSAKTFSLTFNGREVGTGANEIPH